MKNSPRHWDSRGQHPPAGQSSSSHNLYTENWTLSAPLPNPQTEHFPSRRISMRHGSSNPQPHPAALPRLRRQTWPSPVDAHKKLWGPVEALRAVDCGLRLTHRTEDLAWPGTQKKKKKPCSPAVVQRDWELPSLGSVAIAIITPSLDNTSDINEG